MMTRDQQLILAGAGVLVLGYLALAGAGTDTSQTQGAVEGVTWKAGYPQGHEHLALPWDIGSVIWGPHPLYCGGNRMGKYRDPLIAQGWEWVASPPSEETI